MKKILTTVLLFIILCTSVFSLLGCTDTLNLREKLLVYRIERFLKLFEDEDARLQIKGLYSSQKEDSKEREYCIDGIKILYSHTPALNIYETYETNMLWLYLEDIYTDGSKEAVRIGKHVTLEEYLQARNEAIPVYTIMLFLKDNPNWLIYNINSRCYELNWEALTPTNMRALFKTIFDKDLEEWETLDSSKFNLEVKFKHNKISQVNMNNYMWQYAWQYTISYNKNIEVFLPMHINEAIVDEGE